MMEAVVILELRFGLGNDTESSPLFIRFRPCLVNQ
jgi:hypothetical protein